MKILRVDLEAFGPFAGASLDLSAPGPALHVISGRNEAGKSTTLRALINLLFGIPTRTRDAHRHPMNRLRIGTALEAASGERIEFQRRKGLKNTLLDAAGDPLDEGRLRPFLSGVGRDRFTAMFALGHESLRAGAEALLAGEGEVGESLFDAGFGGRGVHAVLDELEREAEEIFTPRGSKRRLNQALASYKEARRQIESDRLSPEVWADQERAIDEARAELAELKKARAAFGRERSRLARDVLVRPLLAKWDKLRRERNAYGDASADVSAGALASLSDGAVAELTAGAHAYRATVQELPELELERTFVGRDVAERLRDLGREVGGGDWVDSVRTDDREMARIRELGDRRRQVEETLKRTRVELDKTQRKVERARARLGKLELPRDVGLLEDALGLAYRVLDLEDRRPDLEAKQKSAREKADVRLRSLTRWFGALGEVRKLGVPDEETVTRFEQERARLERRRQELESKRARVEEEHRSVEEQLDREDLTGSVPTEEELGDARSARDDLWGGIRERGEVDSASGEKLEALMANADAVSDRLRREAKRVHLYSELLARRAALQRERAAVADDFARLEPDEESHRNAWVSLWKPLGVDAGSPPEMRAWLSQLAELRLLCEELSDRERELDDSRARVDAARADLAAALASGREDETPENDVPLAALATRAKKRIDSAREQVSVRDRLTHEIDDREEEFREQQADVECCESAVREAHREYAAAVARLEIDADSPTDAVNAMLDRLKELLRLHDDVSKQREKSLAFAAGVDALAKAHGRTQDGALSPDRRAAVLVELHREAKQRCERKEALERAIAELEDEILAAGDGASIEALREQEAEVDIDATRARLQDVDDELAELNDSIDRVHHHLGGAEAGLETLRQSSAADAAAEAQEHLGEVRDLARRYARARLAAVLLRREIDRYRDENQDPILRRATELFPQLTLGGFRELKTGLGDRDEQVLRCVRNDGSEVGVDGLSDGTRDQLYLALRIASLERHAAHDEPMPFIVDDILINFDDQRSLPALEILGELSATTQVLFFTHHARLVELARQAVAAERLHVHDLDRARTESEDPGVAGMPESR